MPTVRHTFDAACPPAALWAVLSDLGSVAQTNPMVTSVEVAARGGSGIGATRTCTVTPKGRVTERVCSFEEGRAIGFEVTESSWPISMMAWKTVVEARDGGSRLSQTLDYRMKFGPLGWLLNALVMRRALDRNVGAALEGVIRVAEGRA